MHHVYRILAAVLLLAVAGTWPADVSAQDSEGRRSLYDADGLHVYAVYLKVPWARVDSLIQLEKDFAAHTEKGREMGCWVDREFLIHYMGGVYNVVYKTYRTEFHWPPQGGGCAASAWRAVVPDADERARLRDGNTWVFEGTEHYDEMYWEPYPRH